MAYVVYFSRHLILLQQEILNHPPLLKYLEAECSYDADLGEKLATIATYCNIAVDAMVDEDGLDQFAEVLLAELLSQRAITVNTGMIQ